MVSDMRARTEKQHAQWKRFAFLGNCVGTARWVQSKVNDLLRDEQLTTGDRDGLQYHMNGLVAVLLHIARKRGWNPSKETRS